MSKSPLINIAKLTSYWLKSAEHDLDIAQSLWKSRKYDACLFFCHLTLEKMLKGVVTKETGAHPPHTHNLLDLVRRTSLENLLEKDDWKKLAEINEFNIAGRYPDAKLQFHKKCTKEYGESYYHFTQKFFLWLKNHPKKK